MNDNDIINFMKAFELDYNKMVEIFAKNLQESIDNDILKYYQNRGDIDEY